METFETSLVVLRAAGFTRETALVTLYECRVDAGKLLEHLRCPNTNNGQFVGTESDLKGLIWIYGEDSPEGQAAKAELAVQADQQAERDAREQIIRAKNEQVEKQKQEIRDLPETPPPPIVPLW